MNQLVPQTLPFSNPVAPDPRIEQSLGKTVEFLRGYSPPAVIGTKDILDDQYKIDITQPLAQFNHGNHRAFAATDLNDGKQLVAMVCEAGSVQRHSIINRLLVIRHPNVCSLIAAGKMELSQPNEERYVLFYERVKGTKLSTMMAGVQGRVPANIIVSRIVAPLVQGILALQELGITHGNINPECIYYDNGAILGPCALDPCGYSQPYYYELVERMQAHQAGKGDHNIGADFYALAVLVLEMLAGNKNLTRLPQPNLARAILRHGPFMTLTGGADVPEEFFDFLWGMLGSGSNTRWTYRYLKPWLDGKHYNIIPSPPPTEGSKPYECFGTSGHSRREIAHLFRTNWEKVQETLANHSLAQWILMVLRLKDVSEMVGQYSRTIIEGSMKNEGQRNENIMRLTMALDEAGPLHYVKIAFHVDGIDTLFAELYLKQRNEEMQLLLRFIEQNLISAWVETQQLKEVEIPEPIAAFFTKLDRVRGMLRQQGLGFGPERVLYDLNPNLPCQSPMCRGRHITTLPDLLRHMDRIAPLSAASQDPIDAHIAAFMASKLNMTSEVKLYDLSAIPDIASNKSMVALKLFAVAQHRAGNMDLSGLTHWIAQRVLPSMQHLRSNTVRHRTLNMLLEEATEGRTQRLGDLLLDGEIVNVDETGFQKALINYKRNANRIEAYKRGNNLDYDSAQLGGVIAKIFAYMALLMSVYNIYMAYQ